MLLRGFLWRGKSFFCFISAVEEKIFVVGVFLFGEMSFTGNPITFIGPRKTPAFQLPGLCGILCGISFGNVWHFPLPMCGIFPCQCVAFPLCGMWHCVVFHLCGIPICVKKICRIILLFITFVARIVAEIYISIGCLLVWLRLTHPTPGILTFSWIQVCDQ